ncbi:hypothetical protein GCM10023187_34240 [Nibrella viscosa]|uniref:Amine oxidase domain-containing protein n=1 Tax=Nibrella viscosa TaxID=1084524 RepID=A0ABP8KMC3_9BACT
MKSSRTPLLNLLRQAYRLAVAANQPQNPPADELIDQWREHHSRRHFLRSAGQLTLLAGGLGTLEACRPDILDPAQPLTRDRAARRNDQPLVAIIGAGIAGLNAAHTFRKNNFDNFTIYEGSSRTGGRMYTTKNIMAPGLTTELGGEFIDSGHRDMLQLASEFGLSLLDTQAPSELALTKDAYYFGGRHYALSEVVAAFRQIAPRLDKDIKSLPPVVDYRTRGIARTLDHLSISAYLTSIGASGWLKDLLEVAYETEFGLSCQVQSAINLLYLISADTQKGLFDVFGISDERYKIAGGNQQITDKLTVLYQSHIEPDKKLTAIHAAGSKLALTFADGSVVQADYALITLPFTMLREVSINVSLDPVKKKAIQELGYGTNAKLMMGFSGHPWRNLNYSGYVFSDNGLQTGWDNSQMQGIPGAGGYTVYLGGQRGLDVGTGTPDNQKDLYLPLLNQIFPGSQALYNGHVQRFHWPTHPFAKASYACYTLGQWTSIAGAEMEQAGRLFFAGEHCSFAFQGYMNGGAETGRRAAREMLRYVAATSARPV